SYNAGTTTPTPTFTDSTGGTQNPNPIILDAAGGANIWLGANGGNNYKFVLQENGVTQWTSDQVPQSQVTSGTIGQIAVYTSANILGGITVLPQANGGTGRSAGAVSTGPVIVASSACTL